MTLSEKRFRTFPPLLIALACCGCLASRAIAGPAASREYLIEHRPSQHALLDADWLFHSGDFSTNEVLAVSFDESQWQHIHLPHDYVLDGGFSETNDRHHGYLSYEVGWYRKHVTVPEALRGQILRLDFDGVFRDSEVWLNGQYLGRHSSGYTPFSYDISSIARPGADNIVAVRVDPREFEGWWYEGGGIYRHVWLTALAPAHLARWGTFVTTKVPNGENGAGALAEVTLQTSAENNGDQTAQCELRSEIVDPNGHTIQRLSTVESLAPHAQNEVKQKLHIRHPKLWSPQSPELYQLRTTLMRDGFPVDRTTNTFGVRTLRFDPSQGFFLNGHHIEIQGTANHQDFAGLGIAVPDNLQAWRVEQLKKLGCNGWRTAHNPPSEALLDACDRLGLLVMDENRHLGDSYNHHSPRGTTATNLDDLATMIQRDRNHPSIIMWSMCNEEGLQGTKEGAAIFTKMMDVVHRYDDSRPVTCAMNGGFLTNGIAEAEDIIGVNYNTERYDAIHRQHPQKMMFGSEDTNQKTTRGEYVEDRATGMCSCYNLSEKPWLDAATRPFMAGTYTWTGFDYRGEPNPYGWPDVSNNTGLLDLCGFPKDKGFYFESCWTDKPMVHLLPPWNWLGKEGQPIRVLAFSNAREVELFLNGRSLGKKEMAHDSHVEWEVPYQPGRLVAKATLRGKVVATDVVETTGAPARLAVEAEGKTFRANGEDAMVVRVSVLDSKGRIVPDAANHISFHLRGEGRILCVSNGNPADHDPARASEGSAFHGRCAVVVQAGSNPTTLQLIASSPGLPPVQTKLKTR